jgi:uncharacterized protein (TIGR02679 family)
VLNAAGHAPTGRREARDRDRARRDARDAALAQAARERLGDEPWVAGWISAVRAALPDADAAREAVDVVARVLDATSGGRASRGEVAAKVLGSAHALDRGRPARLWVHQALAHRRSGQGPSDADLWVDAGLPRDLVSAPVLTWALPLLGDGVAAAVRALTAAGAPAPLTTLTLRDLAVAVPPGTVVLSVENPRLLEAAVQARLPAPVVCTSGEPTSGARLLLGGLVGAGALVRHHGDVDVGGLGITGRLVPLGVVPWRMDIADYRAAVDAARVEGVALPAISDVRAVPATPWDPGLQHEVTRVGLAVEQERVMDAVLVTHGS